MKTISMLKYLLLVLTLGLLAACSGGSGGATSNSNQSQIAIAVKFATPATAGKAQKAAVPTIGPSDSLLLEIFPVNPADVTPAPIDLKPYIQANGSGTATIPNLTDNAVYYFKISLWSFNSATGTSSLSWVGSNKATLGGAGSSTPLSLTAFENLNGMYEAAKPTYYAASLLARGNATPMLQFQVAGQNVTAAKILNSPNGSTFTIIGNTPTFASATLGSLNLTATHPDLYNDGQHWDYAPNDTYWRLRLSSTTGISGNYAFGIQYTNAFGQPEYLNTVAAPGTDYTQPPAINTPGTPAAGSPLTITWSLPTNSAPNDFTQLNITYWNYSTSIFKRVSVPITATSYQIPGSDLVAGDNLTFSVSFGRADSSAWAFDSISISVPSGSASTVGTPTLLASGYKSFTLDTGTANTVYHLNNNATGVPYALVNTGTPQALTANAASDNAPLALARGASGYLIAWSEISGPNYLIMGRLLDNNGVPTGSPFTIDSSTQSQEGAVHISFDGSNYLVVWPQLATMSTTNIVGRYVNATGTVVNSVTIAAGVGINASDIGIIFAAGQYFVAYSDGVAPSFNYYLRSVSTGGTASAATQINTTTSQNDNPIGLAYDGTNLLITMHIFTIDDTIGHIYGRRFSTARVAIGGEFPIATGTTRKFGGWPSFDGTNFLVTYTDFGATSATVYGQRISTAGVLVGSPVVIANNAAFGLCSYSSASSQYQCLYHTYATYVQSVQSMFATINNLYGVTVQP